MVEMFAFRTPVVRFAGAAAAALAVAGLAGCGSTKTSTSATTATAPVVTSSATTGTDAGSSGDSSNAATTSNTAMSNPSTSNGDGAGNGSGTSNSTSANSTSATTGSRTSQSSSHASSTSTGSASSTTGTGTAADTHECRTGQLRAGAYPITGSSGHDRNAVTFTNTSSAACSMRGYPGADIQLDGGRVMHARRVQDAPITTVVLRPGATARAVIDSRTDGKDSGFLVVTPPNQRQSMPVQLVVPAKDFTVGPVTLDSRSN